MDFLLQLIGRMLFVAVISLAIFLAGCSSEAEKNAGEKNTGETNAGAVQLVVYKDPQCGCCAKWVDHMRTAGFDVITRETGDMAEVKNRFGIRPQHRSCHTAVPATGGFVFEGHMPSSVIRQFLAAPPGNARGLIVPGMPAGSPGMEVGGRRDAYDVLLLKINGDVEVFSRVDGSVGT